MNRIYEYRLYPRQAERQTLELLLSQGREVYNAALAQCKTAYEATGKHQTAISQWAYFREWRKQPGILLNASSLQHILRRLATALSFGASKQAKRPVILASRVSRASTVWNTPTATV